MGKGGLPNTTDEFVSGFGRVYGHLDIKRSYEQLWLQVAEEASSVAEAVRERNYVGAASHLADTFCWLCGFIGRCMHGEQNTFHFRDSLSEIVWLKYPYVCPICRTRPCRCLIQWKEIQQRTTEQKREIYRLVRQEAMQRMSERPKELDKTVDMIENVFGSNYHVMSLPELTFHFLEEVGEVAEQIRELRYWEFPSSDQNRERKTDETRIELQAELADVFSWMAAIVVKLRYLTESTAALISEFGSTRPRYSLGFRDIILKYYSQNGVLICRTCRLPQCDISKHTQYYPIGR